MTGVEIAALAAVVGSTGAATGAATLWWSAARHARHAAERAAGLYGLGLRSDNGSEWTGTLRGRAVHVRVVPERAVPARVEVPCTQDGFRLSPRSLISRLLPGGQRTGDRDFDAAVKVKGPPAAVLSTLDPDLRELLTKMVPALGVHLGDGTLIATVPSQRISSAVPELVELAERLDGRADLGSEPLHHAALTDPDSGVRIRAIAGLIQTDTEAARAALRDLATRSPDWLGRLTAARHLRDVVLLTTLMCDPQAPRDIVRRARRALDERRDEGLVHLLQTLPVPDDDDDATVLAHLRAIQRLMRTADDLTPLIRWYEVNAPVPASLTPAIAGIARAASTRAAADLAVAMLAEVPDTSRDTVRLVGGLVVRAGVVEHTPPLAALAERRPELGDVLAPVLRSLELRRAAEVLSAELGLEVTAAEVSGRGLHVSLTGPYDDRPVLLVLGDDGIAITIEGIPPGLNLHLRAMPTEPPPRRPLVEWLHPSVRAELRLLLADGHVVRAYRGKLHLQTDSTPDVPTVLRRGTRLAAVLSNLPAETGARLALAFDADPDAEWRLAFLQGMSSTSLSTVRSHALGDPDPAIRFEAAVRLGDLPTLHALAVDPQTAPAYAPLALRELEGRPELTRAALGAIRAGMVPTPIQIELIVDVIVREPSQEHEALLLCLLELGEAAQRRRVVAALAAVGTPAAVPQLRALSERWLPGPLREEAQGAIESIRTRCGAEVGAVSLAFSSTGGLSEVDREAEGSLSTVDEDEG